MEKLNKRKFFPVSYKFLRKNRRVKIKSSQRQQHQYKQYKESTS